MGKSYLETIDLSELFTDLLSVNHYDRRLAISFITEKRVLEILDEEHCSFLYGYMAALYILDWENKLVDQFFEDNFPDERGDKKLISEFRYTDYESLESDMKSDEFCDKFIDCLFNINLNYIYGFCSGVILVLEDYAGMLEYEECANWLTMRVYSAIIKVIPTPDEYLMQTVTLVDPYFATFDDDLGLDVDGASLLDYYAKKITWTKDSAENYSKINGLVLEYIPVKLITAEIRTSAVMNKGNALKYVPEDLKTEELCLQAVMNNGHALKYVPEDLKTEELCLQATINSVLAHRYVPEDLKTEDFWLKVVRQRGGALEDVPEDLKTKELCLEAVRQCRWAISYVPENLKNTEIFSNYRR